MDEYSLLRAGLSTEIITGSWIPHHMSLATELGNIRAFCVIGVAIACFITSGKEVLGIFYICWVAISCVNRQRE